MVIVQERKAVRRVFVPYMSDHGYAIIAALRAHGIPAEALPEPDEESVRLGKLVCLGKECLPCFLTTGDMLKKVREPGFDPAQDAFLMPTTPGPCKFGQYSEVQKVILRREGFLGVRLVSPDSRNSYNDLGGAPITTACRRLAWRGVVAVDILQKLTRQTRPYELHEGDTDQTYRQCLDAVLEAVEQGTDAIFQCMDGIEKRFQAVATDKSHRRPVIGVVGEIYLRTNHFGTANLERQVEHLGGEVRVAPIHEWIYYTNRRFIEDSLSARRYKSLLVGGIKDFVQKRDEHRLLEPFRGLLEDMEEPDTRTLLRNAGPYIHSSFGGEAVLTVGKAIDYIGKGAAGIIAVSPFNCMPGTVVAGVARKIREDHGWIPWLDLFYDGQETVHIMTRLEAFMHQARR